MNAHTTPRTTVGKAAMALVGIRSDILAMAGDLGDRITVRELARALEREHGVQPGDSVIARTLEGAGWRIDDSGRRRVYRSPAASAPPASCAADLTAARVNAIAADLARTERCIVGGAAETPHGLVFTASDFDQLDRLRQLGLCGAVGQGGEDFTYAAPATDLGQLVWAALDAGNVGEAA